MLIDGISSFSSSSSFLRDKKCPNVACFDLVALSITPKKVLDNIFNW